ncbi:hypothetical protein AAVH_09999 [Aphelenchoides avenae]|nr:hypothetical protein AAVH_09999 [Aphelenchus avenae]
MKAKLSVMLLAIAIVNCVRSDTVQLPVYGSGASFYEHYEGNSNSGTPNLCNPWQDDYNKSQCFNLVEYLTIPMGIGNPEQKFNLTLDSGDDVLVFSDGAVDTTCFGGDASGRPIQGRRLFRSSRSTTFRSSRVTKIDADDDRFFQDTCRNSGPGDEPEGVALVGSDDFKVAGKSARNVPFQVIKSVVSTAQSFWPSDGVFSMAIVWLGKSKSAVYQIASSIGRPQTTLYLKRTSGYSRGDRVGTFTLGGRDAENCDKAWTDLPLGSEYWGTFNTKVNS